jgi:hypothetical protein
MLKRGLKGAGLGKTFCTTKLSTKKGFVLTMNTNFFHRFPTPAGNTARYAFFRKASRAKLWTFIYAIAVLLCGLFLAVAPTKAQSVIPPDIAPQVVALGNNLLVYGRAVMITPQGGKQVRQVAVYIPATFNGTPSVTATVYSPESPGTMFSLYNVKVNDLGYQTQVVFSAANVQIGVHSDYTFICNYLVTGIKR